MEPNPAVAWWSHRWWLSEEYVRMYQRKTTSQEVDRAIGKVAEVFNSDWAEETPKHPVYGCLLAKGLMPLQFLCALGIDLLELEGCLRLPSVVADLRNPLDYGSALFEAQIAAHLKRCGHSIEFRPPLPNGKRSDFVVRFAGQQAYFEIKRLEESQTGRALDDLVQTVAFALSDLTNDSGHPALKGTGFRIDLDESLTFLLASSPEKDRNLIEGIRGQIITEILTRAQAGRSLDFAIPSVASINIGGPSAGSSVNCLMPSAASELGRIVGGRLQDAIEQLHPQHPGIVVVQTQGALETELTRCVVTGLLSQLGSKANHLSTVVLFPQFYSLPTTWAHFRPFAVPNPRARTGADALKAFQDLKVLLECEMRTPQEWNRATESI